MILPYVFLMLSIFGLYLMLIWVVVLQNDKLKLRNKLKEEREENHLAEKQNTWLKEELERLTALIEEIERVAG